MAHYRHYIITEVTAPIIPETITMNNIKIYKQDHKRKVTAPIINTEHIYNVLVGNQIV